MMKFISTLSIYLRYSACLLVFVGLTACGDGEAVTDETPSENPSSAEETPSINPVSSKATPPNLPPPVDEPPSENPPSLGEPSSNNPPSLGEPSSNNPGNDIEPSPTTGTLEAPGRSCSCDADCASFGSNTGVCLGNICMTESTEIEGVDETELEFGGCLVTNRTEGCHEGSRCWGGLCWPDCDSNNCDGACDGDGSCVPVDDAICDSSCSIYCPEEEPSSINPPSLGEPSSVNPPSSGEPSSTNPPSSGEPSPTTGTLEAPGSSCSCDADCASLGSNAGVCIGSICMTESTEIEGVDETELELSGCLATDRTQGCQEGSRCWIGLCWPDCDSNNCDGACDGDGSCAPVADAICDSSCSIYCSEEEPSSNNNPPSSSAPSPTTGTLTAPGTSCTCDADCASFGSNTGICVANICMTEATEIEGVDEASGCLTTDRTQGCQEGSRCWGKVCWPDCDSNDCDGVCDGDGSCIPLFDTACDSSCSIYC